MELDIFGLEVNPSFRLSCQCDKIFQYFSPHNYLSGRV
jgi:hypothetical protein